MRNKRSTGKRNGAKFQEIIREPSRAIVGGFLLARIADGWSFLGSRAAIGWACNANIRSFWHSGYDCLILAQISHHPKRRS